MAPLYNISILGGQYFFAGDKSNLRANVAARVVPVLKLDDEWSLLPRYQGDYRGTKSVGDSVGSGTLFQQGMDHSFAVDGLWASGDSAWRLKPSVNYKLAYLKETRDETWGKGLFDYQNVGVGFNAENVYKAPFSYNLGLDVFWTRFPNYDSLESQSGLDPSGDPLGRERAGTRVLDSYNTAVSAGFSMPYPYDDPKVSVTGGWRMLWQRFPDQPIINALGQPQEHEPSQRQDFQQTMTAGVIYPRSFNAGTLRMGLGFNTGVTYNASNQNTFDAGQTLFIADTYSYYRVTTGPSLNFNWGDKSSPTTAGAAMSYSHTRYLGRFAQNTAGAYTNDKQYQDKYYFTLSYGYPIAQNFRLSARTDFLWAASNQAFEKTYRYTYRTANYLMGFTYDY